MSVSITHYLRQLRIDYLQTQTARAVWEPWAAAGESVVNRFVFTVRQARLQQCNDDMLDRHARNRNDRRAPLETHAALRRYLLDEQWDAKREAGTEQGLIRQLKRIPPITTVEVVPEIRLRKLGYTGAFGGYNFFFVVIRPPHPWLGLLPVWDGGGEWGGGEVWGGGINPDQLDTLRQIIRAWKPAGHSCRFIVFDEGDFSYDGTGLHGGYSLVHCWEAWEDGEGTAVRTPFYNDSYLVP